MSAFAPKNFEEAVLTHKPLKRRRMTTSLPSDGKMSLRSGITRKQGSGMKRRPSSAIPYGTNSLGARRKKGKRGGVRTWKQLIKDLDVLTSKIVRLRDDDRCVLFGINDNCLGSERLQNGHIFGRRSHGARWDTEPDGNCHAQCANCNKKHNVHQWVYYRWYIDKFGQEAFDDLYRRWAKGHKYTRLELQNLVPEFESKLNELRARSPRADGREAVPNDARELVGRSR